MMNKSITLQSADIVNVVAKRLLEVRTEAEALVKQRVKDCIKAGLGFDTRYGRLEITRCNGFFGQVSQAIRDIADDEITKAAPSVIAELFSSSRKDAFNAGIVAEVNRVYKQTYQHAFEDHLRHMIDEELSSSSASVEAQLGVHLKAVHELLKPVT